MADGFDEEEVKILTYVRAEHPDLEGPFLANVHQGRRHSTGYCKRWCGRMWRVSESSLMALRGREGLGDPAL